MGDINSNVANVVNLGGARLVDLSVGKVQMMQEISPVRGGNVLETEEM